MCHGLHTLGTFVPEGEKIFTQMCENEHNRITRKNLIILGYNQFISDDSNIRKNLIIVADYQYISDG